MLQVQRESSIMARPAEQAPKEPWPLNIPNIAVHARFVICERSCFRLHRLLCYSLAWALKPQLLDSCYGSRPPDSFLKVAAPDGLAGRMKIPFQGSFIGAILKEEYFDNCTRVAWHVFFQCRHLQLVCQIIARGCGEPEDCT